MAVNSLETHCEPIPSKSLCSSNSSKGCNLQPYRLVKINFAADDNINTATKRNKSKKPMDFKSPYVTDEKMLLRSQVTEKKLVLKKAKGIVSSFNLAANIYKANSGEFKSTKRNKKVKKSVLTLPNKQVPAPNTCTVSDINDSEYDNHKSENVKLRMKKKLPIQNSRKSRMRPKKDFEFYDRDARYCSQMNINLDCSSTDIFKNLNGDGNIFSKRSPVAKHSNIEADCNNPHDVWAVLRDINRFQFRPSPPMSVESDKSPKKKKTLNKKRNKRKDTRVIETCRTEEFAYISSFDTLNVNSKSPTNVSQTSSFDRITVIDKQDKFEEMCQEFEKSIAQTRSSRKSPMNMKGRNRNKHITQQNQKYPRTIAKSSKASDNNNQIALSSSRDEHIPNIISINEDAFIAVKSDQRKSKVTSPPPNTIRLQSPRNRNTPHTENNVAKSSLTNCKGFINRYEEIDDNFIYSDYSNSSKLDLCSVHSKKDIAIKLPAKESEQQIKGITKVVLSKGQNMALSKRLEQQKRNSRLITTMPCGVTMPPKLTKAEIKRQLGNLKFPLVILGKDQVSSTIQVMNQDPPQFSGLDKQIWPFMLEWDDNKSNKVELYAKRPPKLINSKARVQRNIEVDDKPSQCNYYKDRNANVDSLQTKKKLDQKKLFVPTDINVKLQANKFKPMRQLKDKVIKFLYKKSSAKITKDGTGDNFKQMDEYSNESINKIDASPETYNERVFAENSSHLVVPPLIKKRPHIIHHPWSKAKWASDFIDTVIRKIKNGVYYNQEVKEVHQKPLFGPKVVSIQTIRTPRNSNSAYCDTDDLETTTTTTLLNPDKINDFNTILGFDNSLPALEIKTLNMNQIEVKHSVTNIMVQFDVKVPMVPEHLLNVQKSSSVIAMKVTESNTQIFKCKTSILNAMLPAELCSLLPKMLQRIMNTNLKLATPLVVNKTGSNLSTISEITRCESPLSIDRSLILTHVYVTPEMQCLSEGMFSNEARRCSNDLPKRAIWKSCCNSSMVVDLLPKLSKDLICDCYNYPISLITTGSKLTPVSHTKNKTFCTNTALVPYTRINQSTKPISTFKSYDIMTMIKKFYINHSLTDNVTIQINCDMNNISINMTKSNCFTDLKTNVYIDSNLTMYSLFKWFQKGLFNIRKAISHQSDKNDYDCIRSIDNNKCHLKKIAKMENCKKVINTNHNKIRRKSFLKLYRRYRTTSNKSLNRCISLSEISNMDDFLGVIGPGKLLSSVFDDRIGKKILSSLEEMKSWISEINPQQALLILLLTSKKDTTNLVRFRPLLLQGIAVNRITRAAELDMEIEVIERENLNKFSKYEGIFYLEESIENHDNLLEELYWIAKTTASDYQRPFDESSENLLKSLLEKRKKLNPSYLRVMARYVGLGLLKSPNKKNKQ